MKLSRTLLAALAAVLILLPATAEDNGMISPYSRYGIGKLGTRQVGFNSAMAGVGFGTSRGNEVNPLNPASYAQIDSLSFIFDIGGSLQQSIYKSGGARINATTATLDYATAGFKVSRRVGVSVGILPLSAVGYSTMSSKTISESYSQGSDVVATSTYVGEGGLQEVYLGAGWMPCRYVSVGANIGFVWGSINHSSAITYSDASVTSSLRSYQSSPRTYKLDLGLQGYIPLGEGNRLVAGASYSLGHKINRRADMIVSLDTTSVANAFQLPHTIGAGLSWEHNGRLRVAADYEFQKWGECRYPWATTDAYGKEQYKVQQGNFRDSHHFALGVEYRPLGKGMKWREYVSYRLGFAVTTPYANVARPGTAALEKGPMSYLATAGVNLPIMNLFGARSSVNIALQYEHVQPAFAGQIKENYLRLCVGVNFNEEWFSQWRVH